MEKKIVIVGAGYSGILTAKKLEKKFRKNSDVSITIIDKNPYHTMLTELHEVAANRVDEESIKISLSKVFAGRKVNVVLDSVTHLDFEKKIIEGYSDNYSYDYLVLAAGSKPHFFGTQGAEEHTYKLWSYDDAVLLKNHIHEMFNKASKINDVEKRKKYLNFYIVGAGFTGVEMAGELAEYAPILCKKYEIDKSEVKISIIDVLSRAIPTFPHKLSEKAEKRMRKMGIKTLFNTCVSGVGKDYIETTLNDEVFKDQTMTVIWAAGIQSADITGEAAEKLEMGGCNRICVDEYLRSVDDESIYVIGDNMFYIPEGEEKSVPQVVENCEHSADTAAHNIYNTITKKSNLEKYKPAFHGFMVCIGGRYGVARVGLPNIMMNLPSWLAMLSKHFINTIYFIQVAGWNKVISYMRHEFFTIRNCRSFVGGHFSNRTPSFLLFPLRVWLGMAWLFEGVKKILEGWLLEPKLTGFFGGARDFFESIINSGGNGSTDAVSAATGEAVSGDGGTAVAQAGGVIFDFDIIGLVRVIFVNCTEMIHAGINDFALKLEIPLMDWFVDKFILPYEGVQVAMQSFIVFAEIFIGLALIGGLFTFLASSFSLVLQFMFVATTGLYLGTFWMIFAGIAVLIGGGRTFGLDYYVMPWLKESWAKSKFARKNYLYHD